MDEIVETTSKPALSVIVQIGAQRERALSCLQSLLSQDVIEQIEILVDDFAPDEPLPPDIRRHPRIVYEPRWEYQAIGENKAAAVSTAKAPMVAFIEDHCVAHPGWARAIIKSHNEGWHAVGGQVINGNPGVGISDLIEVMNYYRWLPPLEAGERELLAGHNTAYDREMLLSYGDRLRVLISCDPVLQWVIARDGYMLFLNPEARFEHINETEVNSIMRGYFLWNKFFAPIRAEQFSWSSLKQWIWVIASPLMPLVRLLKISAYLTREKRAYRRTFLRSLPVQLLAHSAAALGQVSGLLFGPGAAEVEFLRYELNQTRRMREKN